MRTDRNRRHRITIDMPLGTAWGWGVHDEALQVAHRFSLCCLDRPADKPASWVVGRHTYTVHWTRKRNIVVCVERTKSSLSGKAQ